jgi:hypothetical protein
MKAKLGITKKPRTSGIKKVVPGKIHQTTIKKGRIARSY